MKGNAVNERRFVEYEKVFVRVYASDSNCLYACHYIRKTISTWCKAHVDILSNSCTKCDKHVCAFAKLPPHTYYQIAAMRLYKILIYRRTTCSLLMLTRRRHNVHTNTFSCIEVYIKIRKRAEMSTFIQQRAAKVAEGIEKHILHSK